MANKAGRSGRGLDEVLHYFIGEDEQAEARARSARRALETRDPGPEPELRARASPPWCFAAQPGRLLCAALALELARAMAAPGAEPRLLATFPAHPLLARGARSWQVLREGETVPEALARLPGASLVVLTVAELAVLLPTLSAGATAGVVVPVETSSRGLAQALAVLRALPRPAPELRVGALCVGSAADAADAVFRRLDAAARRQLGLELELLGGLQRTGADYRGLLRGVSVFESDPDAPSVVALGRVRRRLEGPRLRVGA